MKYFLLVFISLNVFACLNDYDCEYGEICIRSSSIGQGLCYKKNTNVLIKPRAIVPYTNDRDNKVGVKCSTNFDCGFGNTCMKVDTDIYGV
jgi:hypothetical protein